MAKRNEGFIKSVEIEALKRFESAEDISIRDNYFYLLGEIAVAFDGDKEGFEKCKEIIDNIFIEKKKKLFSRKEIRVFKSK